MRIVSASLDATVQAWEATSSVYQKRWRCIMSGKPC
jgi:hypothetical protein